MAAGDEHEPEQRLDHVRVQDVVAPGEEPVRVEDDGPRLDSREQDVEGGRQRARVLAVVDDVPSRQRRGPEARPAADADAPDHEVRLDRRGRR